MIEPAQSAWASPVVIVPKQDGSYCFCFDYRRLNAVTIRDVYSLPRMDDYIDSFVEASVCTTLDCNLGYWQIPIREEDRDKTAFTSHAGTFRFIRMPLGLTNAPAMFQRRFSEQSISCCPDIDSSPALSTWMILSSFPRTRRTTSDTSSRYYLQ